MLTMASSTPAPRTKPGIFRRRLLGNVPVRGPDEPWIERVQAPALPHVRHAPQPLRERMPADGQVGQMLLTAYLSLWRDLCRGYGRSRVADSPRFVEQRADRRGPLDRIVCRTLQRRP